MKKFLIAVLLLAVGGLLAGLVFNRQCSYVQADLQQLHAAAALQPQTHAKSIEAFNREPEFAYLSYPEWLIVWSSQEYASWIAKSKPSQFPYFTTIQQFWGSYCHLYSATQSLNRSNLGGNISITVLGVSYTVENLIKGVYEHTVGWLTEWTVGATPTPEDVFAAQAADRYAVFILARPFYEFPYHLELAKFWQDTPWWGPGPVRKWERKFIFTVEYGLKSIYGWIIRLGTQSSFGVAGDDTYAVLDPIVDSATLAKHRIQVMETSASWVAVKMPRYQDFLGAAKAVVAKGGRFQSIAGNKVVTVSLLAAPDWKLHDQNIPAQSAIVVLTQPLITTSNTTRYFVALPVPLLHHLLRREGEAGMVLEHIYDF